jgi:hypothetical protein
MKSNAIGVIKILIRSFENHFKQAKYMTTIDSER